MVIDSENQSQEQEQNFLKTYSRRVKTNDIYKAADQPSKSKRRASQVKGANQAKVKQSKPRYRVTVQKSSKSIFKTVNAAAKQVLQKYSLNPTPKCVYSKPILLYRRWSCRETSGDIFCKEVFLTIWERLKQLYADKYMFALRWILSREDTVERFVTTILNIPSDRSIGKGVLLNGYKATRQDQSLFDNQTWNVLEKIFEEYHFFKNLPKPVKYFVKHLKGDNLLSHLESVIIELRQSKRFSMEEQLVQVKSALVHKKPNGKGRVYDECFLGTRENIDVNILHRNSQFQCFTADFVVARTTKNYTFFVDQSGPTPKVIATLVNPGSMLLLKTRNVLRCYMEDLFLSHPKITRKTKPAFTGHMAGFGPFYDIYTGESAKVSFYTHKLKLKALFESSGAASQFDEILDKYCHNDFIDIMLGLYWWLCPEMLHDLFSYSMPYLRIDQYEKTPAERYADLGGPNLYQLYVTRDYCSRIHQDNDAVPFSLCYCSNPDAPPLPTKPKCFDKGKGIQGSDMDAKCNGEPIHFVTVDVGVRLDIRDGQFFSFRSLVRHCSAMRPQSQNAAYVSCVTVNNKLHNVLQRRQLQRG